ncbi:ABC transporter substrate-binding protein [Geodermatophilus sabuli]|uniref:Carbohydrate ABC transporter substrate-binding protein, CUT1 family n=1 Tax=Geodermatophilus sabuli TaxID=1564158 RepID=A0A285E8Q5_9ACTN|nr:extracellular solute-binding protein [Geodermatophilus sabuli]MBB3085253.1 multiple sugar transport system substrate-binding protein [Geodermatophilus sabuli]SNX95340.1 carbohydrate ABC transporter substrate-binding protein, CUT1 family [Geodermatophilus sabuli]
MRVVERPVRASVAAVGATVLLAACGGGDTGGSEEGDPLTVWTLENLPDRLAVQEEIAAAFTGSSGVEVELVAVDPNQFNQLLISSAAAGRLPDVIGALPLAGVQLLATNDLIDREMTASVVEGLGAGTFSEHALELTRDGDAQVAVPSDGWAQLLVYRKDLFDAAGLAAPETYDEILAAAQELDSPEVAGFVGATVPNDAFTQQTFEHLALGNGCQLVDDTGEVTIESEACVGSFAFYDELISDYSVSGAQDVDTTRAAYFAGQSAMVVWSSFILDEMAGLRADALPTCPECAADPAFLARNSGVVTGISGPDGDGPEQFGDIVSWAVTVDAQATAANFVDYMMEDGYEQWIGFSPEGKVPTRQGTAEEPTRYIDAWATLPSGVDTKAPLTDFYTAEVLDALRTAPDRIGPWGIPQGQGALIGASLGELPVPQAIAAMTEGEVDPSGAARQAAEALREIASSVD